jgi:hypothetical protein
MSNSDLLNVTSLMVAFATNQSSLIYIFNNTDAAAARSSADAMTPKVGDVFQDSFTFVSTGTSGSEVNVTYSGLGKTNLAQYTQSLMTNALDPSLGGVSTTFLPMSYQTNAVTGMVGMKDAGTFNWTCSMLVSYTTSIPLGSDSHVVDVLSLLNVSSLAPSSFAYSAGTYASEVAIYVSSNDTVSYVSSQPALASPPSRGWSYHTVVANEIAAMFNFGDDASAVSPLTFTFSGIVFPEFPPTALLLAMMLATTIALMSRKRIRKMRRGSN